jgi:putative membrane protein
MRRSTLWFTRGAVLALLPLLAACGGNQQASETAATTPPPAPAPATPALSVTDSSFLDQAARSGMVEVQESQLAEKRAPRAAVRRFANTMVKDHTWVNQSLDKLANAKQVTLPSAPSDQEQAMISQLEKLHGSAFDRAYLNQQATLHQQAVQLFQTEAQQGTDPDLKSFAEKVLPRLQEHLSMVEKLGGRATTTSSL